MATAADRQPEIEGLQEVAQMRFGRLCRGMVRGVSEDGPAWVQFIDPEHLSAPEDRERLQAGFALLGERADTGSPWLDVLGADIAGGGAESWLAWRATRGPSLRDVQMYLAEHYANEPEQFRAWLFPILKRLAAIIDELVEQKVEPEGISLAPEHLFADIGGRDGAVPGSWDGSPPERWGAFDLRILPICLDLAVPSVIDGLDRSRRLNWLNMPLQLRFAGLVYSLFNGKTYPDGCQFYKSYRPAPLLGEAANKEFHRCFENPFAEVVSLTALDLFDKISKTEGRARAQSSADYSTRVSSRIAPPPQPSPQPRTEKVAQPLPPPGPADADHRGAPVVSPPKKSPWPPWVPWVASAGVAVVAGGLFFLLRPGADTPSSVAGESLSQEAPSGQQAVAETARPSPAAQPDPAAPDPAERARALFAAGDRRGAGALLLSAARAETSPPKREELLRLALGMRSAEAAVELAKGLRTADPIGAARMYWEGFLIGSEAGAGVSRETVEESLAGAADLGMGGALFERAKRAGDARAATPWLVAAIDAFEKGNAATARDARAAREAIDFLGADGARVEQVVAMGRNARGAGDKTEAARLFNLAVKAGSANASAELADLRFDGRPPQQIPLAEMDEIVGLLRAGADRGSADAMLRLSDLYSNSLARFSAKSDAASSAKESQDLVARAADLGNAPAMLKMAGFAQSRGDTAAAINWAQRADRAGLPAAKMFLRVLQNNAAAR